MSVDPLRGMPTMKTGTSETLPERGNAPGRSAEKTSTRRSIRACHACGLKGASIDRLDRRYASNASSKHPFRSRALPSTAHRW